MAYTKIEQFDTETTQKLAEHYEAILALLGEDPKREGLLKTPERVAKAMQFLTQGYNMDPVAILNSARFKEDYQQIVLVKDIEIYSMCEHHMLPFYGKAHVAYIPNGVITGLSKIPRVVDAFARRLQVQERMTNQISQALMNILDAEGVGVVVEGQHLCMQMRGVEKQHSVMTSSSMRGVFRRELATRNEFTRLIR